MSDQNADHETATLRAAVHRALAGSRRWRDETSALSLVALDEVGPVDLDACTPDELDDIALWANDERAAMPAHLVAYLGAVKESSR